MFYNLGIPFLDDMICKLVFGCNEFVWTFCFWAFCIYYVYGNKQADINTDKPRKEEIYIFNCLLILGAETAAILQACDWPASTIQLLPSNFQGE